MLRHQVDVFATQEKTIPLACRIEFSSDIVEIEVPNGTAKLFELRLKSRLPLPCLLKIMRIERFEVRRNVTVGFCVSNIPYFEPSSFHSEIHAQTPQ